MSTDRRRWSVWSTTAEVVVTRAGSGDAAAAVVRAELDAVERACSRFRTDTELAAVEAAGGAPTEVSPLLADLVGTAVAAARDTDGAVDPTVGGAMDALGYDRDLRLLDPPDGSGAEPSPRVVVRRTPRWSRIAVHGRTLTLPAGVHLDLGATAKARAADRAAARVADALGCGVLVNLGGDLATAGPAPVGGWQVVVGDPGDEPRTQVGLPAGAALATSSTRRRRWSHAGVTHHHVLDPATGLPADPVWRTVSVVAGSAVAANTRATAAIVAGTRACDDLARSGLAARLVAADGTVRLVGAWPAEQAVAA